MNMTEIQGGAINLCGMVNTSRFFHLHAPHVENETKWYLKIHVEVTRSRISLFQVVDLVCAFIPHGSLFTVVHYPLHFLATRYLEPSDDLKPNSNPIHLLWLQLG